MTMPKDTLLATNPTLPDIDPITARVIGGALENVALEMGHKLARMSYSSIIRESEDFGAAILDPLGRQLAECPISTPLQLGPIPGYLQGIFRAMEEMDEEFYPGDVIMHNHTYYGASHGPDIGIGMPIFRGDELVGFSFTTAHHLDVGALSPGSCGIVDAMDAYAEGLQFKAIKLYENGRRNNQVWRILHQNIRSPGMVVGDMEAQVAACRVGAERYLALIERFGYENVLAASEELMNYSDRMMRQVIADLPDGTYYAEDFLDGFLDSDDPSEKDLKIAVTVTIDGEEMTVDLDGTSPQVPNKPINMPFIGTVDIAIYVTLRSVLLDSALMEYVPQNDGLTRAIHITAPRGCLANPIYPAPVIARFCPGNIISATVMKALAPVAPHNISAGIGNLKVAAYSGVVDENYWVYMDITEGSYGGRYGKDGMDAVDTLFANTRNNPIEDIESHYPLRVTRYELVEDKAGPGKWRGGLGSIREMQFLADSFLSLEGEGNKYEPWGVFGGEEGTPGAFQYIPADSDEVVDLPSKIPSRLVKTGETYRTVSPCGGGYGDPLERDPQRVLDDVRDEYVSLENARRQYGVVIDAEAWTVDEAATGELRREMRVQRDGDGHSDGAGG
ncbi:MAG TPA: hydantoinase B/oxoprolinase family protein [Candidatus Sulfomarinibacteraceae bacterium]|nr:hydantoinase B/oxoprolinase family protein [Candidatus Sulfomarinibacteraceae bacterium]